MIAWLLSPWGQRIAFLVAGVAFVGIIVALVYRQGEAAALAAAAGAVATRTALAAKARAAAKTSEGDKKNDPDNRDNL